MEFLLEHSSMELQGIVQFEEEIRGKADVHERRILDGESTQFPFLGAKF